MEVCSPSLVKGKIKRLCKAFFQFFSIRIEKITELLFSSFQLLNILPFTLSSKYIHLLSPCTKGGHFDEGKV